MCMSCYAILISDDESPDVLAIEFVWPSMAKSFVCKSLKPIHKNRQDKIKLTFDVAKCDRIFDELHKVGYIRIHHSLRPLDEMKK